MTHIVVDVESDGPIYGIHSMIAMGAVALSRDGVVEQGFHGLLRPLGDSYIPEALAVSGFNREETLQFPEPKQTMMLMEKWLYDFPQPWVLWSDNNGYDAPWINYYSHLYLGYNPFGWTSRRISDFYCGTKRSLRAGWKHLRDTEHTHNPEDDARGNAEALYKIFTTNKVKYG